MFLGTSSKFSDLAHSARQSTVTDPNTDGQTSQLQSICVLSCIYGPVQVLGAVPSASSHSTPCQDYVGADMASDPTLPTLEPRLRGGGKHHGFGKMGLVHAESGLALECRVRKCGEPHSFIGKNGFTVQSLHTATKPRANSPGRASCPAWGMPYHFASTMPYCVERSKKGQGAEMIKSFKPSYVGEIVWHQQILAGKVLLTRSQSSNLGSQAC